MRIYLLFFAAALAASAVKAESALKVVTEEFPPFQYSENGKLVGPAAEVVEATLAAAELQAEIRILPWARAMKTAHEEANVLIFSIARIPEREELFKWIGPISDPDKGYMYALTSRGLKVGDLEQAKSYVVGTSIDDFYAELLVRHGFQTGGNLQLFRGYENGYAMLKAGHIDMLPLSQIMMGYFARKHGDDPAVIFTRLFQLTDIERHYSGDYLAASPKTPDEMVERLRRALQNIKDDGTYAAIQKKWHG